jgi:hypothetical protein
MSIKAHPQRKALKLGQVFKMQILVHAHAYQRAWKALQCIGTPEDLIIYQKLENRDLVVVKDITSANKEATAWHGFGVQLDQGRIS